MDRVEEWLDAEAVTRCEKRPLVLVPQHERELTTQFMQALSAEIFVEMQCDFAIRTRAQVVSRTFEPALSGFVVVELTIDDNVLAPILTRNGLFSGSKVDNAESSVTQSYQPVRGDPLPLPVRPAMI